MTKKIILYFFTVAVIATSCKKESVTDTTIKDADGNVYTEVKIGTQTWLLENLKTTKFRNGDPIPNLSDFNQWKNAATAAYSNFANDVTIGNVEGRLYNWFAVSDARGIAPQGYHIPSMAEMQTLNDFLGGVSVAGGKLKSVGETFWTGNIGATNLSGFAGIGAGIRNTDMTADPDFIHRKILGRVWTSTPVTTPGFDSYARFLHLQHNSIECTVSLGLKKDGVSVRCIKD